VQSWDSQHSD
jgi:hypothetical protein